MFTHGIKDNVFFQYHVIIFYLKTLRQILFGRFIHPGKNLFVHSGNTRRCFHQSFSVYIFANRFQKHLHRFFDFCFIYHEYHS